MDIDWKKVDDVTLALMHLRGAPCDQLGRTSGDHFGRTDRDQLGRTTGDLLRRSITLFLRGIMRRLVGIRP
jgi:hypothetical protein